MTYSGDIDIVTYVLPKLERVRTEDYVGYYLDDLKNKMPLLMYQELTAWMNGQTMAIDGDRLIVYHGDLARFLFGKAIID